MIYTIMSSKQCISWQSKETKPFLSSIPNLADEALLRSILLLAPHSWEMHKEDSEWYRIDVKIWLVPIQIIEDVMNFKDQLGSNRHFII